MRVSAAAEHDRTGASVLTFPQITVSAVAQAGFLPDVLTYFLHVAKKQSAQLFALLAGFCQVCGQEIARMPPDADAGA